MQKIILSLALLTVGFCINAFAQIPTSGLIANYTFDNATAIGADAGPNGYALTNTGTPTVTAIPGITDQNLVLNGGSLLSSTNAAFNPTSVTVAGWVYRTSVLQYSAVAGVRRNAAASPYNAYFLSVGSTNTNKLNFTVSTANAVDFTVLSNTSLALNKWYHVAGTYDAATGTLKVYINGVLDGTFTQAGAGNIAYSNNNPFCIGGLTGVNQTNLSGQVDDVLVYNRALTATEITAIAAATAPATLWQALNLTGVVDIAAISSDKLAYVETLNPASLKRWVGTTNTGTTAYWGGSLSSNIEQIAASSDGAAFAKTVGVSANNMFRSTQYGLPLSAIASIKTSVAAVSANEAYATNINNFLVYQYTNTSGNFNGWAGSNGAGNYIAASENGRLWVIGTDTKIYAYVSGAWNATSASQGYTSIALANNQTYSTDGTGRVYKYVGGNAWAEISSTPFIVKVTAAADGTLYGKTSTNEVYRIPLCVNVSATAAINNCGGANLTATGTGASYVWSNTATTATTTVATAGTYTVTTTNATGCTGSASVVVTAAQIGVGLTPQTITGAATSLTNSAQIYSVPTTANVAYQWSLPLGGGTITSGATTNSASITWGATAGTFRVKVVKTLSGSVCPSVADSMTVTLNTPPPALRVAYSFNSGNANNDLGTNNNGTVTGATLTTDRFGNPNKAYAFNGGTTQNINVGDVTALNNTPAYSISMWFSQANPNATAGGLWNKSKNNGGTYDDFIQSRTYNGTFYNYNMVSPNVTYNGYVPPYTANTWTHFVIVFDGTQPVANRYKTYMNGSLMTTSVSAGTFSSTSPNLTGGSLIFGQANAGYFGAAGWGGSIDDIYIINRVLTQTQIDSLRNAPNPCNLAAPVITGNTSFCAGFSATLIATGGTSYIWSNGDNTADATVTAAGIYTVTATANGCGATASVSVTANAAPTAAITGNTGICLLGSTTLTASGGTTYAWSNNTTTAAITVNNSAATYTVTVTNANNCTASTQVSTSALLTPKVNPTSNGIISLLNNGQTTVCTGTLFTLANDFIQTQNPTYVWNNGTTAQGLVITPTATTSYSVTITNNNGCTATGTIAITVNPLPTPTFAVNGNVLTANATYASYQWVLNGGLIAGANSATYTITQNGNYALKVTDANGCEGLGTAQQVTFVGTENNNLENTISLSPNPLHDVLYLKTTNTDLASIQISDIMGRTITQINQNMPNTIDFSNMQSGVYFIRITDKFGNAFTQKIIKE